MRAAASGGEQWRKTPHIHLWPPHSCMHTHLHTRQLFNLFLLHVSMDHGCFSEPYNSLLVMLSVSSLHRRTLVHALSATGVLLQCWSHLSLKLFTGRTLPRYPSMAFMVLPTFLFTIITIFETGSLSVPLAGLELTM